MASYWNPSPDFHCLLSESSERALMRFVVCTGGPVLFHTGVWQEAVCQTEPVPVYGGRRRTNLLPCLTPPLFGLVYRVNGNAVSTFCAQQRTIIALHN